MRAFAMALLLFFPAAQKPPDPITTTVRPGESLLVAARRLGVDAWDLFWSNPELIRAGGAVRPGQVLRVPPGPGILIRPFRSHTAFDLSFHYGIPAESVRNADGSPVVDIWRRLDDRWVYLPGAAPLMKDRAGLLRARRPSCRIPVAPEAGASGRPPDPVWPVRSRSFYRFGTPPFDLAATLGDPALAALSGVVARVGGGEMEIASGPFRVVYRNLAAAFTACGDRVRAGEAIGAVGDDGRGSVYLRVEIYRGDRLLEDARYRDLPAPRRPVGRPE